jgi:hypothetical protein
MLHRDSNQLLDMPDTASKQKGRLMFLEAEQIRLDTIFLGASFIPQRHKLRSAADHYFFLVLTCREVNPADRVETDNLKQLEEYTQLYKNFPTS